MKLKPKQMSLLYAAENKARSEATARKKVRERVDMLTAELQALAVTPEAQYRISSPEDIYGLVSNMSCLDAEELWVISLNTRNRVTGVDVIYRGSVNSTQVRVGELFRPALLRNAAAIIVVHNHPSGDPTPSADDVAITRGIVQAGKLLDVDVLDHAVVGGNRLVSLKERGLGF